MTTKNVRKSTKAAAKKNVKTQAQETPIVQTPIQAPLAAHVIQTTFVPKGATEAKKYSCGAVPTSRTAKINAFLAAAKGPLATKDVTDGLLALYGVDEKGEPVVKCIRNHLSTLLAKGAVTFTDKKWALVKAAPATVETPKAKKNVKAKK